MNGSNYMAQTESRLRRYRDAEEALAVEREKLEEYRQGRRRKNSRIRERLNKSGYRVDTDQMLDALIQDTQAEIAKQEAQIQQLEKALACIADDPQYQIIQLYYLDKHTIAQVAQQLNYAPNTIRNAKKRLVHRIAIRLYGLKAL